MPRIVAMLAALGVLAGCMLTEPSHETARYQRGQRILDQCIATRCEKLNLDGSYLRDFSQLNDLTHVKVLMVSYTNFDSFDHIASLTELEELHIRNSDVADISALDRFADLRVLHVGQVRTPSEEQAIASLAKLEELAVTLTVQTEIGFIGELQNLRKLSITSSQVESFAPLATLAHLRDLEIRRQAIDDIAPILKVPNLEFITGPQLTEDQEKQLRARGVEIAIGVIVVC